MRFRVNFKWAKLDRTTYMLALYHHMRLMNEKAGRIWLDAAVERIPIPTWSGASRATFQRLASELNTTVPIGPKRSKKDRRPLGAASAVGSGVIEDRGKGYWGFKYVSNLRYLAYNEFNRAVPGPPPQPFKGLKTPTPYGFQEKGAKAWLRFATKVRLPSPLLRKYLKRYKIK